jgi:hypothetical protein
LPLEEAMPRKRKSKNSEERNDPPAKKKAKKAKKPEKVKKKVEGSEQKLVEEIRGCDEDKNQDKEATSDQEDMQWGIDDDDDDHDVDDSDDDDDHDDDDDDGNNGDDDGDDKNEKRKVAEKILKPCKYGYILLGFSVHLTCPIYASDVDPASALCFYAI